ncbi:MAG: amidohydrolase family protein [Methanocellales archaeon]
MRELIISGTILCGANFTPLEGYICVDRKNGIIKEIGEGKAPSKIKGIIIPSFINAHTHLGDSIAKDIPFNDLDELVKPPFGIKHQILKCTPTRKLCAAMRSSLKDMLYTGTSHFIDFREGGIKGVKALQRAMQDSILEGLILGRPESEEEAEHLLNHCHGFGISGANDFELEYLEKLRYLAKRRGKYFAIHAGEKDRSDIDTALSLEPDILVHMTHALPRDLKKVADKGIPIVLCPRSNFATRVAGFSKPNVRKMIDLGICLGLGTDNVLINSPCMFTEMEFLSKIFLDGEIEVLRMATLNGAIILGMENQVGTIETGKAACLIVINKNSNNIRYTKNLPRTIVRRARPDDIIAVVNKGKILRSD